MNKRKSAKSGAGASTAGKREGWLDKLPMARLEIGAAAVLTLWVLALHLMWLFSAGPLWRDEVGTIDFASMPSWAEIWRNLQYDNFPPFFVAVARLWMGLGISKSDFGLRVLGFLVGTSALGILWWNARILGARAPLLALALFAMNPLAIRVCDSLRPYGLGIALTAMGVPLVWNFAQSPESKKLLWATLAAVLSVQCLYQAAFFVLALSCGAWAAIALTRQWKTAVQIAAMGGVAALSLLPHLVNIKKGREWFGISYFPGSYGEIAGLLTTLWRGPGGSIVAVWLAIFTITLGIALFQGAFRRKPMLLYLGTSMIVAVAAYVLFIHSLGLRPRAWYFLILQASLALAIEGVVGSFTSTRARLCRIVVAVVIGVICIPVSYAGVRMRQSNVDVLAAKLKADVKPGDMVLVSPWYDGVSLQRYLSTIPWSTLPPIKELRVHRYDLMKQQMEAEQPIASLLAQVEQTLRAGHTLWVVDMFRFPPPGQPQPILPPYRGQTMDMADARYFSSWMFQISGMVQNHATSAEQVQIPAPGNLPVNPFENLPLFRFAGWHD